MAGDVRCLAQAISAAENQPVVAHAMLGELGDLLGRAHIVGITGPPGAGKSTLTGRLAAELAERGYSVGLLLVDPSSPFTGGAILGDRLRLPELTLHPHIYVRSMSSRGSMGGLARATSDAIKFLDAFGKDIVLVETVGTGQAETDIIQVADSVIVVAVPGLGDDIQAMKAGILEIADLFVVNKADREGAAKTERELLAMLKMQGSHAADWSVPVIPTIALKNQGIVELADSLQAHCRYLQDSGLLLKQRAERVHNELNELLRLRLLQELKSHIGSRRYAEIAEQIALEGKSVYVAADELWQEFVAHLHSCS